MENGHSEFCNTPLFLVLHGNNPTIWKKQNVDRRWELPRVPFLRIRPATSVIAHEEAVVIPLEADFSYGVEFGVVIGKDARQVPEGEACNYIAGYTCINDMYCRCYQSWFGENLSAYEQHARDTLAKSVDGCGGIGPALISKDTIPDLYDLLAYTLENGRLKNRAHTGSYLIRLEYLIAYLSRFMTLPAGTVISMGAAGWDGIPADLPKKQGASVELEVEIEQIGRMKNILLKGNTEQQFQKSPFLLLQEKRRQPAFTAGANSGRSFWVCRGNYRACEETENFPARAVMCPHLFPSLSLAGPDAPLIIPSHATRLSFSAQLAAVIGPKPAYRVTREQARDYFAGYILIIALQDSSLIEPLRFPVCYEERAAYFLGGCGDGFYRASPLIHLDKAEEIYRLPLTISHEGQTVKTSTSDYVRGLEDMLTLISHGVTLLPGDVLSLGPAGRGLIFPEDKAAKGRLQAALADLIEIEIELADNRGRNKKDREIR